ncbi:MAG: hypothetical protein ACK4R8_02180 [Thiobacillus sp.]
MNTRKLALAAALLASPLAHAQFGMEQMMNPMAMMGPMMAPMAPVAPAAGSAPAAPAK